MKLEFKALGDQGLQIIFGQEIDEKICMQIQAFASLLAKQMKHKSLPVREYVPAYTTLSVYYDALQITYNEMVQVMKQLVKDLEVLDAHTPHVYDIPTLYGAEFGPDLADVAAHNQLSEEEVIRIHAEKPYLIYMLGFTPGFPYLGGMSERIAAPRLANPRAKIAAGSVGIAGEQTGIYPLETPGGWRIIGRTPVRLYQPELEQPFLLQAGSYIKFVSIDAGKYEELEGIWKKNQEISLVSYPKNHIHAD
ncbi:5-oxoprolinase subunit PxpB [Bacillus horti]|uniref:Inhibitor of KinA n=1 Tax=Caldalkalibacillus horti TaxID=77523 RepID=A0ABT9VZN9_9BACI|nr:5-oxoprolinase subunit PxpB [Bacillus horti]MDQ0166451.1 inhibitor of KinA [Bacillus horti]